MWKWWQPRGPGHLPENHQDEATALAQGTSLAHQPGLCHGARRQPSPLESPPGRRRSFWMPCKKGAPAHSILF